MKINISDKISSLKNKEFDENLLFSYHVDDLPTKEMIDWFDNNSEFNQEENFFDRFQDELMDLSYFQMLYVFRISKAKSFR